MALCMTVRNCETYLPRLFNNIDRLQSLFSEFVVIVAYDHCSDQSERLLKEYKVKSHFPVHLLPVDNPSPLRTVRIATARNACLDVLETLKVTTHFMVDADNVNVDPWNLDLIRHYLNRNDWDVLTFNRHGYYDIWALMYPPFQHHCWGFFDQSKAVVNHMRMDVVKRLNECSEWIPCQSAFNGFAMYKTPLFKGIRYDGEYKNLHRLIPEEVRQSTLCALSSLNVKLNTNTAESCEHLYYHLMAMYKNRVRVYISKHILGDPTFKSQ